MFIESYRKDEGLEKALKFCLKEFGREVQIIRAIKEMGQLTDALTLDLLYGESPENKVKIAKQLADLKLMVQQLDLIYTDFTRSQYDLRRQELIRKTKGMEPWSDGSYSPEVLPGIGDD